MQGMPLHPAIVHLPLGLAFVLPLLAAGIGWAVWTGRLPRLAWSIVLFVQLVVLGAGLVALRTGEADEERVERVVAERYIESHEEAAQLFVICSGVAAVLIGLGLVLRGRGLQRASIVAGAAATLVGAVLAFRAGHEGGQLVYARGAASAHVARAGVTVGAADRGAERGEEEGDDDDDD